MFKLKLCKPNGETVVMLAGRSQESDLVEDVVRRVLAKGVGFWKTEKQVEAAVRAGVGEAFLAVKQDAKALVV